MSQLPSVRDTGLRLDGARLRRELYIRGCTAATIARLATLSPNTLTRCLAGDAIRQQTLRELVKALATMPVLDVDLVVSPETTKTPSVELDVLNGENGVAATTRRL
jgi:transcriptional regulator with XRE-family HTH domain